MNDDKSDFWAGIIYLLLMLTAIITGICGIIFGQHRPDLDLLGIFLIVVPTIDLTRRFTIGWIYVKMEKENKDDDEIK